MQPLESQPVPSESMTGEPNLGLVMVDPPNSGEYNMAIDEALLKNAMPDWPVVLRVYQWVRPTLSLGNFQKIEDIPAKLQSLPWVRRKTGGGAILHDRELTYSIVIPNRPGHPTKGHSEALYRAVHLVFVDELVKLGWDAELSESCSCKFAEERDSEPFLCFLRRSPVDLVVGKHKILGSAQRRSSTGLLQHGSFLLRSSQLTAELAGLLELSKGGPREDFMRRSERDDAYGIAAEKAAATTASELDPWLGFFVASLKLGVSRLLQVNWRNGMLQEVLAMDERFVV